MHKVQWDKVKWQKWEAIATIILAIFAIFGTALAYEAYVKTNDANNRSISLAQQALQLQNFNSTIDPYLVSVTDYGNWTNATYGISPNSPFGPEGYLQQVVMQLNVSAYVFTPHYGTVSVGNLSFSTDNYTYSSNNNFPFTYNISETYVPENYTLPSMLNTRDTGFGIYFDYNRVDQTSMLFDGTPNPEARGYWVQPEQTVGSGTNDIHFWIICNLFYPINSIPANYTGVIGGIFYIGKISGEVQFVDAVTKLPITTPFSTPVIVNYDWVTG